MKASGMLVLQPEREFGKTIVLSNPPSAAILGSDGDASFSGIILQIEAVKAARGGDCLPIETPRPSFSNILVLGGAIGLFQKCGPKMSGVIGPKRLSYRPALSRSNQMSFGLFFIPALSYKRGGCPGKHFSDRS